MDTKEVERNRRERKTYKHLETFVEKIPSVTPQAQIFKKGCKS